MTLALLALLPVWYLLVQKPSDRLKSVEESPYYMECLNCGAEMPCGQSGSEGMPCPRCPSEKGLMLFRTRSGVGVWDLIVKLFVGVIAFMAVVVLVFAGQGKGKPAVETDKRPKEPATTAQIRSEIKEELNNWARELVENRRKRVRGED
jgi:hypothetical protein